MALDELGRGTATSDGAAIASAVLNHLSRSMGCRGLFATHYHTLSDDHADDPAVAIRHMGCAVVPAAVAGGAEEVTFLYKLAAGACPKSYGTNVARLAGLPESVVHRAAIISEQREEGNSAAMAGAASGAMAPPGASGGAAAPQIATEPPAPVNQALVEAVRRISLRCGQLGAMGDDEMQKLLLLGLQESCGCAV